jgi:hypothetical protein
VVGARWLSIQGPRPVWTGCEHSHHARLSLRLAEEFRRFSSIYAGLHLVHSRFTDPLQRHQPNAAIAGGGIKIAGTPVYGPGRNGPRSRPSLPTPRAETLESTASFNDQGKMVDKKRRQRLGALPPPEPYSWFTSAGPRRWWPPASPSRRCRVRSGARPSGSRGCSWRFPRHHVRPPPFRPSTKSGSPAGTR